MAASKPARGSANTARPGNGQGRARDRGTRGGRPDAAVSTAAGRPGGGRDSERRTSVASRGAAQARAARERAAADAEAGQEQPAAGPARWLSLTTLVLAIAGLGVSVYLTIAHYNSSVSLACPATSTINCEKVTTSPESIIFGIPVAVYGLAFYVFLVAAMTPWAWRAKWPAVRWARLGSLVVGMVFVLYLIYTELFTLDAICLWCTSVHVITFILFGLVMFATADSIGSASAPHARLRA
jgi:uncharacterized membrane protein